MTVLHRFCAGLGALAAALSACANPTTEMTADPSHPASASAPTAPAFTFAHSLEDASQGPGPSARALYSSGSGMDHGHHGGARR